MASRLAPSVLGIALAWALMGCPPAETHKKEGSKAGSAATEAAAPAPSPTGGGVLQVDVLDVGQGDAILLRSPGGKTVLIDAGTGQKGESALPLLQGMGVKALDLVVATHPHSDHIGGMDEVLEALPAKLYIDNGLTHDTDTYNKLMALVEARKIAYKPAKVGQTFNMDSGVKLTVLNPAGDPISGTRSDLNANSVVLRATYGSTCFLFVGDAEAETEERLLANKVEPCDVLKAAHHGSGYASTAPFLAAVRPKLVLVSVGEGNSYGHPDPSAMARYADAGARVLRTDEQGTLHAESDGVTIRVTPARGQGASVKGGGSGAAQPTKGATKAATTTAAVQSGDSLLNLNKATVEQLIELPGIGEKTAEAIVADRKANGPFRSVDDLGRVKGVGDATVDKVRDLVTVR